MSATLVFMSGFCFLRTPIAQRLGLVYLTLQCGQSSLALALCAAASGLFTSELAPSGVGSTERAHRLIYLSGGYSESFMVTWHDRWGADSIRVHLEIYRNEMHALCALQTLTGWMIRPHAKRIKIQVSSRGMEQSFDDGVHVILAEAVDVGMAYSG